MNYVLHGTAPHTAALREAPLQRSGGILVRPGTGRPSTSARPRRHWLSRVRVALSARRRTGDLPVPGGRASDGSGISPTAGGASRGVVFLIGR